MTYRLRHILLFVSLPLLFSALLLSGCTKENDILHDSSTHALSFSCDTLAFDTVFTSLGTTTRHMRVYNHTNKPVRLASVSMLQGSASPFRLNVDGDTSLVARNIRIEPGDSMFIFIQATINPTAQNTLFIVEDAIMFDVEGCAAQRLPVTAWGRNAVYHVPTDTLRNQDGTPLIDRYGNPYAYSLIACSSWDHSLPHVIVGYAVIDTDSTLSLSAGDQLYFANGAVLWTYNGGTLSVAGTDDNPVLFTSLRHDGWYRDLPGQWGHIWLGGVSGGSSRACTISHARIENSYYGIIADSNDYSLPTLSISNSEIAHIKVAAIQADDAWITASRLLLYDCGGATIYIPFGGRYTFSHITSANYWRYDRRETPSVILANWYESSSGIVLRDLSEAIFTNCIIYGNHSEGELLTDPNEGAAFGVSFENCLIRGGQWDQDPMFEDIEHHDYHTRPESPAPNIGYYGGL